MACQRIEDVLPPLPLSLTSVSPYLQRAEELRLRDPIMAYWCTYYAAQLGLDQKSHEPGAKDYLLALITLLEGMKKDVGANDAIEHEAAGAAYVENFALKVFALADNEDRKGQATRSTAKKFLAAANFLELLRVFEKSNNAQVNDEKVRYAKWKASDIAKACRVGRKPTPGSADGIGETESSLQLTSSPTERWSIPASIAHSPSGSTPPSLPADTNVSRTPPPKLKNMPDGIVVQPAELSSPGNWSTLATPGSEAVDPLSSSTKLAFASAINRWKDQSDVDASAVPTAPAPMDISSKKVHFSSSVTGGLSSTDGSPPASPDFRQPSPINVTSFSLAALPQYTAGPSSLERANPSMVPLPESAPATSAPTSLEGLPPPSAGRQDPGGSSMRSSVTKLSGSPPSAGRAKSDDSASNSTHQPLVPPGPADSSRGHERRTSVSKPVSPRQTRKPHIYPIPSPSHSPSSTDFMTSSTYASLPPADRVVVHGLPPTSPVQYPAPAPVPSPRMELTPSVIAKAQKHCRFAISALEYEDAEEARKDLRAALVLLGDR